MPGHQPLDDSRAPGPLATPWARRLPTVVLIAVLSAWQALDGWRLGLAAAQLAAGTGLALALLVVSQLRRPRIDPRGALALGLPFALFLAMSVASVRSAANEVAARIDAELERSAHLTAPLAAGACDPGAGVAAGPPLGAHRPGTARMDRLQGGGRLVIHLEPFDALAGLPWLALPDRPTLALRARCGTDGSVSWSVDTAGNLAALARALRPWSICALC